MSDKVKRIKEYVTDDWNRQFWTMEYDQENMLHGGRITQITPGATSIASYASLFSYDPELLEANDGVHSRPLDLNNIVVDYMLFDFDSPVALEYAQADTFAFCNMLSEVYEIGQYEKRIWFSGLKGFHVEIPASMFCVGDSLVLKSAASLKTFARELAGGYLTADMRIYDMRRLVRLPFVRHKVSGLFRIPITHADLHGPTERITEAAQNPRGFNYELTDIYERPSGNPLLGIYNAAAALSQYTAPRTSRGVLRDYFLPARVGERNAAATKLTGLLKHKGIELEITQLFMQTWNRTNPEPLPDDELSHLVAGVYRRYNS